MRYKHKSPSRFRIPGPNPFGGFSWTLGYEFIPAVDIEVTDLGFFDLGADGLGGTHEVALWDANGNLISSTFVSTSDPIVGFYRFSSISPVQLSGGNSYVVGSHDFTTDLAIRDDRGVTSTVDPDITITGGRWTFPSGSINFPGFAIGNAAIFYDTVSFAFTRVPEMQSGPLSIMAAVVMMALRRRHAA